jgi:hypothetical protein
MMMPPSRIMRNPSASAPGTTAARAIPKSTDRTLRAGPTIRPGLGSRPQGVEVREMDRARFAEYIAEGIRAQELASSLGEQIAPESRLTLPLLFTFGVWRRVELQ